MVVETRSVCEWVEFGEGQNKISVEPYKSDPTELKHKHGLQTSLSSNYSTNYIGNQAY